MPPRKRARLSRATSPTHVETPEAGDGKNPTDEDILNDPWTDEEEIGLFKGLIRWKPTGIHKHFRMVQLREYLLEHNYIHPRSTHTQLPGIWRKLGTLYDLEALDQREDARQLSDLSDEDKGSEDEDEEDADDVYSLAANKIHKSIFELSDEDYAEKMWAQRLAEDREESPPMLPELNLTNEAPIKFTPSFSIEVEESTPAARSRGRPSKGASRGRAAPAARRSRRQTGSVATASDADEQEGTGEDEASEGQDEDDDEDENDEEATSETSATAPRGRGSRGRGGRGSRGRPRGRRR